KFQHRVPWFDEGLSGQSYRLYRLFEFLATGPRGAGMTPGTRVPGRININTIWDAEILLALCDPQTSNNFVLNDIFNSGNQYDTGTLFGKLISLRSPGIPTNAGLGQT